ncbi:MAG: LysM peptidoglycan-binding domain-containing protein [Candidatus Kapabacteria bacterium]|nr:LysM peptidoglycan-binding domain-containing protein [Candidatus Kapabacteria bacterium]
MKRFVYIIMALVFATAANAQVNNKPDTELTKDEAVVRINEFTLKVQDLTNTLTNLDADIIRLQKELEETVAAIKDCNKSLYDLIGATEADVAAFRQKLGVLEGKVRSMKNLPNDVLAERVEEVKALDAELQQLKGQKIAVLPEFYDRIVSTQRDIKGLYRTPSVKRYTVGTWAENKDCLWNISGNIDNYGDPFMWPKIWQANTDIIRNPDIIHPGQVLTIPAKADKTDDEIKAERKYWRNKRAAAARKAAAAETATETK